jgi:hypothetical protein
MLPHALQDTALGFFLRREPALALRSHSPHVFAKKLRLPTTQTPSAAFLKRLSQKAHVYREAHHDLIFNNSGKIQALTSCEEIDIF